MSRPSMSELVDLVSIKHLPLDKVSDDSIQSALAGKISYPAKKHKPKTTNTRKLQLAKTLARDSRLEIERAERKSYALREKMFRRMVEYESDRAEAARSNFGASWSKDLFSAGLRLLYPSRISAEDVVEALLYVWRVKGYPPPTLPGNSALRDSKRKFKHLSSMADYLNMEHTYDRERQAKAQDLRAHLRYLRQLVLLNPMDDDRSANQNKRLSTSTIDLPQMVRAVKEVNAIKVNGRHDDEKLNPDYVLDLASCLASTPRKRSPASLDILFEPRNKRWFKELMASVMG